MAEFEILRLQSVTVLHSSFVEETTFQKCVTYYNTPVFYLQFYVLCKQLQDYSLKPSDRTARGDKSMSTSGAFEFGIPESSQFYYLNWKVQNWKLHINQNSNLYLIPTWLLLPDLFRARETFEQNPTTRKCFQQLVFLTPLCITRNFDFIVCDVYEIQRKVASENIIKWFTH